MLTGCQPPGVVEGELDRPLGVDLRANRKLVVAGLTGPPLRATVEGPGRAASVEPRETHRHPALGAAARAPLEGALPRLSTQIRMHRPALASKEPCDSARGRPPSPRAARPPRPGDRGAPTAQATPDRAIARAARTPLRRLQEPLYRQRESTGASSMGRSPRQSEPDRPPTRCPRRVRVDQTINPEATIIATIQATTPAQSQRRGSTTPLIQESSTRRSRAARSLRPSCGGACHVVLRWTFSSSAHGAMRRSGG